VSEPPILENPGVWVGILSGRDDVAVVIDAGKPQEQRLCFAPLVAMAIAAELAEYAQKQLDHQRETFARHKRNTMEQRRPKLDA
jgi:hypothetical protein